MKLSELNGMTSKEFLNLPVPMKHALSAVTIAHAFHVLTFVESVRMARRYERAFTIQNEALQFLLERATDEDARELNEKMNFWRVVQDLPIPEHLQNKSDED